MTRLCYYNLKPEKLYEFLGIAKAAGTSKGRDALVI
jgi:hypothetical protein